MQTGVATRVAKAMGFVTFHVSHAAQAIVHTGCPLATTPVRTSSCTDQLFQVSAKELHLLEGEFIEDHQLHKLESS